MNHTPDYAALERDRNSRIANASAALFEGEKKRLADIQRQTELAFARLYGGKLTPEITARLLEGQILDAEVLCTVSGAREEEYSIHRARGLSQMQAWLDSTPDGQERGGEDTARNSGSRCERYPYVTARILFLQKEATKQRETLVLNSKSPLEWMQEISHVFRLTADAYSHLSLQKRSKLKSYYAGHLVRMAALEGSSVPARQANNDTPMWENIEACKCQK